MKTHKVNLNSSRERQDYSLRLQAFECQFTYPLLTERFELRHGAHSNTDYFSFFEQLGTVSYMVCEDKGEIVAAVCAVLNPEHNAWYLCDFKITPNYRKQNLYRRLMWRYFLQHYLKSSAAYAINMRHTDKNPLFRHTQHIFKKFDLAIEPRYLSQFSKKELASLDYFQQERFESKYLIVSNEGKKDLWITGAELPLYHIVPRGYQSTVSAHTQVPLSNLEPNAQLMYMSFEKTNLPREMEVSFFHRHCPGAYISSAQI